MEAHEGRAKSSVVHYGVMIDGEEVWLLCVAV